MTVIQVELFDTTFKYVKDNVDSKVREKYGFAKVVPTEHLFEKWSEKQIESGWIKAIQDFSPDLIGVSVVEDQYELCNTLLTSAKKHFNIPVVIGGTTPTVSPQIIIENPNIDYLIQGEGEVAFKELINALENKSPVSDVPNLWYKENGKVKKTELVRYIEMNDLPNQNTDFWDKKHFLKPL